MSTDDKLKNDRKASLNQMKDLMAKIPREKMERSVIGFGEITFSANEFVDHIEKIIEEGNQFLDAINAMTYEILKKIRTP